jgi:DNA-binding response OmpR family regulator
VKRVLVVDDDDDMRELMVMLLSVSYEVAVARDGAEGLEMARRLRPDLVVLDLLMPRMHGFEVCHRIRADTAVGETGADGYIVKPFEIEDFKGRIAALLGDAP